MHLPADVVMGIIERSFLHAASVFPDFRGCLRTVDQGQQVASVTTGLDAERGCSRAFSLRTVGPELIENSRGRRGQLTSGLAPSGQEVEGVVRERRLDSQRLRQVPHASPGQHLCGTPRPLGAAVGVAAHVGVADRRLAKHRRHATGRRGHPGSQEVIESLVYPAGSRRAGSHSNPSCDEQMIQDKSNISL